MRLLHTSDWHLGRSFHREQLLDAQAAFVDHLVDTVRAERVELVVVAGDVYDRALPPVDAVRLADEALTRLAALRVPVVVIAGNHDSARRLGFAAELIAAAGVHVRSDPVDIARPVVVDDEHGPVAVYGVPYLEPDVLARAWDLADRTHAAVAAEAMRRVAADLATRPGTRSVMAAHMWVSGASPTDSERDITVGGVAQVPATTFAGIDYVALGHLHGRQQISPAIGYSGSPLAYSFSEARQRKGSWLVDLGPRGVRRLDHVDAPVPRRLGVLRGHLDALLADPALARHEHSWLQVTLTDPRRPAAAMERLRRRFPHALVLQLDPDGADTSRPSWTRRITGRSDPEIVRDFVHVVREAAPDDEESALLDAACSAVRHARVDDPGRERLTDGGSG
ncbi:MAG: exonuclease SbcCD subunit D [Nocardioidaceae bacterium]|jgi:exonuclease SbcD|nr:exonuclease SbcCD subunit D [Nocardioidaceae bacterium]